MLGSTAISALHPQYPSANRPVELQAKGHSSVVALDVEAFGLCMHSHDFRQAGCVCSSG